MTKASALEELINRHLVRRPLMSATDVYKLLHQGVFGIGHLLDPSAELGLNREAASLDLRDHQDEPLLEEVSIDGSVVRVNLRPYLRRGLPLPGLYHTMMASEVSGDAGAFIELWTLFREAVNAGRLVFDVAEIEELTKDLGLDHIPVRHHSDRYRHAYRPAYRVTRKQVLLSVIEGSGML